MKLSEAIRLGSVVHKQIANVFFEVDEGGEIVGTCALGGAIFATGRATSQSSVFDWLWEADRLPNIHLDAQLPCDCKKWDDRPRALRMIVPHLNNVHQWTREQIADWVETIEPKEPPCSDVTTSTEQRPAETHSENTKPVLIAAQG